ncbi:MAG: pirin family protein [Planctomycetales bacterium]|nr:pirin family protein [Planctomycetales bacterium]
MIRIRRAHERGHANHGWLNTHHTFSFGGYVDPAFMGFRSLRVINEDRVAAGQGFGTHPHKNMEIVSYVLAGALEHRDSLGNGEVLRPGEFQRISAGTGITHSEFNPSKVDATHFYQIWLLPAAENLPPSYEQQRFDDAELRNKLRLVASPSGENGGLTIHQDARVYLARLDPKSIVHMPIAEGRHAWLQVLRGTITINGQHLETSDGAAVSGESGLTLAATTDAEIMLFDLA